MLRQAAEGVLVHESAVIQSNAVVVQGPSGVLLVDRATLDMEAALHALARSPAALAAA